jgi:NTE family protein
MPVAFVLSGGASFGASQAGMLEALYEYGVRPDILIGTSVGAINAAFIASRPATPSTARELQAIWRGLTRGQIFPANPLSAGLGLLGMRDHSVPVSSLRKLVRNYLEVEFLEDASVGLHVVATDLQSGEDVLLSDGPAVEAVLASAAVPGVFPPVPWGGRMLTDGGIVNNTPISHAVALGAKQIVVLPAIGTTPLPRVPRGALAACLTAVSRAVNQRFAADVVRYADAVELIVLPPPMLGGMLPTDFARADELITESLTRARGMLARRQRRPRLRLAA